MKNLNPTVRDLIFGIGIYTIILEIIGIIFVKNRLSYTLGLAIGVILSGFMAFHMYKAISEALDMDPNSATKYTRKKSLFRWLVMLVVLSAGMYFEQISFFAVAIGILSLKFSAFMQPFVNEYITKKIFDEGR